VTSIDLAITLLLSSTSYTHYMHEWTRTTAHAAAAHQLKYTSYTLPVSAELFCPNC